MSVRLLRCRYCSITPLTIFKANPRLAERRDDDNRLPLHWAVSNGHLEVVKLLVQTKTFNPDEPVRKPGYRHGSSCAYVMSTGRFRLDSIDDCI